MARQFILALDQGTTGSRAIVFDRAGDIKGAASREITQIFPEPGWVEHDPDEIQRSQLAVAVEAIGRAGIVATDLAAIGIANQRETVIVWERASGTPIHNAIVWQDRRTAAACDRLRAEGLEPAIAEKTGLLLDPYFSATKLAWLLDNVPRARERARNGELAAGTVDTWLVWQLTGGTEHVTDVTNASRTMLYNVREGKWDEDLLRIFDIPRALLPEVRASSGVIARTAAGALPAGIPIAGMAGDQQAALFGQCCCEPGMAKNTYGTGGFALMHTGGRPVASRNRLLTTAACPAAGAPQFALEGSVFIAGAVVQWLRDGLGIIRDANEVERLAASVPDNGGVYLVPAFTGAGSPHWDPYARGTILGLTRGSTAAHIARAALEGIAFQTADVIAAMESDSGIGLTGLRVDGGAARNDLLLQFQADLLGIEVVRSRITETTALGAAYLAGLGVGFWQGPDELAAQWQADRTFQPQMDRGRAESLLRGWRKAVGRAGNWATDDEAGRD